ncbi:MAG: hypothetical protein ISR65_20450 [Bacteriovoracaceae bacterium]|nr:hypothetical protein [Bacteriovoracaceae bacterium]
MENEFNRPEKTQKDLLEETIILETKMVMKYIMYGVTPFYLLFWICDWIYAPANAFLFLQLRLSVM